MFCVLDKFSPFASSTGRRINICYTRKLSLLDGENSKLIKKCVEGDTWWIKLFQLVLENSGWETANRNSMNFMQFKLGIHWIVCLIHTVRSWGDINQTQMMLLMFTI